MKLKGIYILSFLALVTTVAYGASQLGRNSKITYPDLGNPSGASQVNTQQTAVTNLSDDDNSRYRVGTAIADSTLTVFDHDFGVAFSELNVIVYTGTFPALTRVPDYTAAGWVIAATGANPKTQIDVTTPGSGGPHTFVVMIIQGKGSEKLNDLSDVDVETIAPEAGQSLVWDPNLGSGAFKPGASGDSSLKCQAVADPNVTLKSGFLILDSGVELQIATDLTVSLDTILGSNPVDATAYYLYLDLDQVPAATLLANGRQVRIVSAASHFSIQTVLPDQVLGSRYVPLCLIKSATSGTVWSGAGSDFATLATRRHGRPIINVSPTVYELSKQSVGSVGSSSQVKAGHVLTDSSFSAYTTDLSYFNLNADVNDETSNTRNLTNNNSATFTGTSILGVASGVVALNGSTQYLSSTNAFFNPGDADFSFGGWFKSKWATDSDAALVSQWSAGGQVSFRWRNLYE